LLSENKTIEEELGYQKECGRYMQSMNAVEFRRCRPRLRLGQMRRERKENLVRNG
jgi:hypothetical protein